MPSVSTSRRHAKKQASIVVTVMLIMVISSFLVLLTMRYFLGMLNSFTALTNYYKAYYMARGGMDVLKTQHAYRGRWYETQFSGWGSDFDCGVNCDVGGSITSRFPRIDASHRPDSAICDPTVGLSLSGGQSMIFALFADPYVGAINFQQIDSGDYAGFPAGQPLSSIDLNVYTADPSQTWRVYYYDAQVVPFGQTELLTTFPTVFNAFAWGYKATTPALGTKLSANGKFMIISNPGQTPFSLCLSAPNKNIIGPTSIIRVDGRMQDTYVSLEAVKTNRFPSILLQ